MNVMDDLMTGSILLSIYIHGSKSIDKAQAIPRESFLVSQLRTILVLSFNPLPYSL